MIPKSSWRRLLIFSGLLLILNALGSIFGYPPFSWISGLLLTVLLPGIGLSALCTRYWKQSQLERILVITASSILVQGLTIYFANTYIQLPFSLFWLQVLLIGYWFFSLYIIRTIDPPEIDPDQQLTPLALSYLLALVGFTVYAHHFPHLVLDSYLFRDVTEYILHNHSYPNGFQPSFFPRLFWNYEPLYQSYLSIITILSQINSLFVYRYLSTAIHLLTILPLTLITNQVVSPRNRKFTPFLVSIIFFTTPTVVIELLNARPQTLFFFYYLVELYLLVKSRYSRFISLLSIFLPIILAFSHIFYIFLIIPTILTELYYYRQQLWKRRNQIGKIASLIILILLPYLYGAGLFTRLSWLKDFLVTTRGHLTWRGSFFIDSYEYYLGFFLPLLTLLWIIIRPALRVKKTLNIPLPVTLFIIEILFLLEGAPRLGFSIILERFFFFLAPLLVILSVPTLQLLWQQPHRGLRVITAFLCTTGLASSLYCIYGQTNNDPSWISQPEITSLQRISHLIPDKSLIITPITSQPLVLENLPGRFIVADNTNPLFTPQKNSDRTDVLTQLCPNSLYQQYQQVVLWQTDNDQLLELARHHFDGKALTQATTAAVKKQRAANYHNLGTSFVQLPLLNFGDSQKKWIAFLTNRDQMLAQQQSLYLERISTFQENTKAGVFILYANDQKTNWRANQSWWPLTSLGNADLRYFDQHPSQFTPILHDGTLSVWRLNNCPL